MGAISAAGAGVQALWEAACEPRPAAALHEFDLGAGPVELPIAAVPAGALKLPEFPGAPRLDRSAQLALAAGRDAWDHSGLDSHPPKSGRVAVIVGTSRGPVGKWDEARERQESGKRQLPSLAATGTIASLSGALAHLVEASGTCLTISSTCASGAAAIALGASLIESGAADVAVVGGAEAPLSPLVVGLMRAANLLGSHEDPTQSCRPFDQTRNGLVVGEAAGILILESRDFAKKRNARPLARLSAWATGLSHSGKTGVDESGDGLAGLIADTLTQAGIGADAIGYINAHGTGTLLNDLAESKAIRRAFGADPPPISSTKPVTGHCLGATPAL
jgi:3-oxoacyl-(acyl-carrier-protein) synthase